MTEKSFFWNGTSLGDAQYAPYHLGNADYESPFVDLFLRAILNGDENRGVFKNWENELEVTGAASPVSVDTGGAVVYGMPYENTAAVNVVVSTPTTDTRYDRIVLRRDWTAQTIRITLLSGVEGGSIPAMTQSPAPDGSGIYDVPLATLEVTTAPVITITDDREFCQFATVPDSLVTAQFVAESADLASRETRTKRRFIGAPGQQPEGTDAEFGYSASAYLTSGWPQYCTWNNAGLSEEGWIQAAGDGKGALDTLFKVPADYAGGTINVYLWWMYGAASLGAIRSTWQIYQVDGSVVYPGTYNTVTCTAAAALAEMLGRTQLLSITGAAAGDLVNYFIVGNGASVDALTLGIEFTYTGYL